MMRSTSKMNRGMLVEVHIADLHFAAFDPKTQFDILQEQFLNEIATYPRIDIITVLGDIFDHKLMANSDGIMLAVQFIDRLIGIARQKNATVVLLAGTLSHDANQLKLFYHYMNDPTVDVRVVTTIQFEIIKGAKILCIPELYGLEESIYRQHLFGSGWYDSALVHGTFKGAVYGDNVGNGRLFTIEDFINCSGPIISGHVHNAGCFNGYYYYCGCPYRWKFGEEQDKGFIVLLHDLDSGMHYVNFNKIESFRYDTIYIDELTNNDPKAVIDYINDLKYRRGIDFIKVRFRIPVSGASKTIISNYYRNINDTTIEFLDVAEEEKRKMEEKVKNSEYDFILDDKLSDLEKFVMYVNHQEQSQFITVDQLKALLEEEL
jgi:DNA repair exonuclease SbcCD nuclease subunit